MKKHNAPMSPSRYREALCPKATRFKLFMGALKSGLLWKGKRK